MGSVWTLDRSREAPSPGEAMSISETATRSPVRGTIVYGDATKALWEAGDAANKQQDETIDSLAETGSAINDGLAAGFGGIVDLANTGLQGVSDLGNAALDTVGLPEVLPKMSERPFMGADMARDAISAVVPRNEAETWYGRVGQRAVQEAAASIPGASSPKVRPSTAPRRVAQNASATAGGAWRTSSVVIAGSAPARSSGSMSVRPSGRRPISARASPMIWWARGSRRSA